ncbi:VRR-NUC domain-containing protein [Ochrobactrum sp. EDr1-4]|uniref:VRR-NUC domain-containing protein n=1 Tax=Ochrobactrum sp. EDr1-4 TaxID=3368622 RepID=UPI003BA0D51C
MKEAQIHKAVIEHWRSAGLPNTLVATIPNMGAMGQYGLTRGLPDLLVIGPRIHGYIELKTIKGKLSEHQDQFRQLCITRGIPFAVTYGRDEPIRVLQEWGIVKREAQ